MTTHKQPKKATKDPRTPNPPPLVGSPSCHQEAREVASEGCPSAYGRRLSTNPKRSERRPQRDAPNLWEGSTVLPPRGQGCGPLGGVILGRHHPRAYLSASRRRHS